MSRLLIRTADRFKNALASHNVPGLKWLIDGFNHYDKERLKEIGPDRLAAEWIVKCGGKVKFDKVRETFEDYNALIRTTAELDPRKPEQVVHVLSIDATDSSISGFGCRHFNGLEHLEDVRFVRCKSLQDFGLEYMGDAIGHRLPFLEIESCPRITEYGLKHLEKFTGLKSLVLNDLRRAHGRDKTLASLEKALPNCDIKYMK
jgi:H+-transporting ATP synthase F0 complex subunit s